jgi:hypothetical protein
MTIVSKSKKSSRDAADSIPFDEITLTSVADRLQLAKITDVINIKINFFISALLSVFTE